MLTKFSHMLPKDISSLNKKIIITVQKNTPDNISGYNSHWEKITKCWANIIPYYNSVNGRENKYFSKITYIFIFAHKPYIPKIIRILHSNDVFEGESAFCESKQGNFTIVITKKLESNI